jgi:hypothetical protein
MLRATGKSLPAFSRSASADIVDERIAQRHGSKTRTSVRTISPDAVQRITAAGHMVADTLANLRNPLLIDTSRAYASPYWLLNDVAASNASCCFMTHVISFLAVIGGLFAPSPVSFQRTGSPGTCTQNVAGS